MDGKTFRRVGVRRVHLKQLRMCRQGMHHLHVIMIFHCAPAHQIVQLRHRILGRALPHGQHMPLQALTLGCIPRLHMG